MSMDLLGAGGTERISHESWCKVLELAYQYGWKPQGTEPPQWCDADGEPCKQLYWDPDEWNGSYFTNDHQWVARQDAANIADALERALDDIPDFATDEKWVELPPSDPLVGALVEQGLEVFGHDPSLSPVDFFSGEGKQHVNDFIKFCRAGGFYIG